MTIHDVDELQEDQRFRRAYRGTHSTTRLRHGIKLGDERVKRALCNGGFRIASLLKKVSEPGAQYLRKEC